VARTTATYPSTSSLTHPIGSARLTIVAIKIKAPIKATIQTLKIVSNKDLMHLKANNVSVSYRWARKSSTSANPVLIKVKARP
jgi:hypothetical protein